MKLDYAIVFVADMSRSVAFYRGTLGIPLKLESPEWTEFSTGDATLALHASRNSGRGGDDKSAPGHCHPGLVVESLDEFHARMLESGVRCAQEPRSTFGARIARYLDPDACRSP